LETLKVLEEGFGNLQGFGNLEGLANIEGFGRRLWKP